MASSKRVISMTTDYWNSNMIKQTESESTWAALTDKTGVLNQAEDEECLP